MHGQFGFGAKMTMPADLKFHSNWNGNQSANGIMANASPFAIGSDRDLAQLYGWHSSDPASGIATTDVLRFARLVHFLFLC